MDDTGSAHMDVEEEGVVGQVPATHRSLTQEEIGTLVLRVIAADSESLLRLARRNSLCADDAQDAYQRGLEIFMRHAARLDPDRAGAWLHTVVKHEAMAVRRSRAQFLGSEEVDFDVHESHSDPLDEQIVRFERLSRSAEALKRLKPQEVRALWLKALGNSYSQIQTETGWSYTKVNRCLVEGRKAFLQRYADIEGGEECRRWVPVLSAIVDGEASSEQLVEARPHLRNCAACRAVVREMRASSTSLAGVFPVAAVGAVSTMGESDGGNLLTRAYEALSGGLHERATASVIKLQAALDMGSVGKVAAVAASAAALSGGGVAVVERATGDTHASRATATPAARDTRSTPASSALPPGGVPPRSAGANRTVVRHKRVRRPVGTREFGTTSAMARGEFVVTASAATPVRTRFTPTMSTDFEHTHNRAGVPNTSHSADEFGP